MYVLLAKAMAVIAIKPAVKDPFCIQTQYNAKWPISLRCRLCVATTDKSSKSHCYVLCSSICLQQEFNHNYVTAFIPVSYLVFLALTQARKLFSNLLTLPTFSIPHIRSTKICKISSFEDLTFLILGFLEVKRENKTIDETIKPGNSCCYFHQDGE